MLSQNDSSKISLLIKARLAELDEMISGERLSLSSADCGICRHMREHHDIQFSTRAHCVDCPLDRCMSDEASQRRSNLYHNDYLTSLELVT